MTNGVIAIASSSGDFCAAEHFVLRRHSFHLFKAHRIRSQLLNRKLRRTNHLFCLTVDDGETKIELPVVLAKGSGHQIIKDVRFGRQIPVKSHQSLLNQFVIEAAEGGMLNNCQDVKVVLRSPMLCEEQSAILLLLTLILWFPPHLTKAAANGLLQQNARLAGTKWHNHTNVVDVESFTKHQHRHNNLRCFCFVEREEFLFDAIPFLDTNFVLLVGMNLQNIVRQQSFFLQEMSD